MTTQEEIVKAVKSLGLNLSDGELETLESGNMISLETRGLSEIGSIFILAAALCPLNSEKPRKTPLFQDICGTDQPWTYEKGIPVYCWSCQSSLRYCLYLFLLNGIPSFKIVRALSQTPEQALSKIS